MAGFFITGTDTGVGKTRMAVALMHTLISHHFSVMGMKPVASGCRETAEGLRNDDAEQLMGAASAAAPYDQINPYAFAPAIAPHLAARQVGQRIELASIVDRCQALANLADFVVVEGVGGWRVPLGRVITTEHMAKALDLPVILVVGLRLGCLNHALLTAQAIEAAGIPFCGWVANQIEAELEYVEELAATLTELLPAPCVGRFGFVPGDQSDTVDGQFFVDLLLKRVSAKRDQNN